MSNAHKDLAEYFSNISSTEIERLYELNYNRIAQYQTLLDLLPEDYSQYGKKATALLMECLPNEYDKYINHLKNNHNSAKNKITKSYLNENPIAICLLYLNSIFFKSDDVINTIREICGEEINVSHFVDIYKFEKAMLEIVKAGVLVNYLPFLHILDMKYTEKVYKTLMVDYFKDEVVDKYDKRNNVTKTSIEFKNIMRKKAYSAKKPRAKSHNETLFLTTMHKVESKIDINEFNISRYFNDTTNLRDKNKEIKKQLSTNLIPFIKIYGKKQTINIFKPYFRLLFDNDKTTGFLDEDLFDTVYKDIRGESDKYEGNYERYYYERIIFLAGLK